MSQIWEQNEEKDEEEELVVTEHRDVSEPAVTPDDEQQIEAPSDDPRSSMDVLGEDVSSSPARRGHEDPEIAAMRHEDRAE